MSWSCKICCNVLATRKDILKHYRLHHGTLSQLPCIFQECPCSFKSWNCLHVHLSRSHAQKHVRSQSNTNRHFTCLACGEQEIPSEGEYFTHLNNHLKKNETIGCVFQDCSFQTNIFGTFKAHNHRHHTPRSSCRFKTAVLQDEPFEQVALNQEIGPAAPCTSNVIDFDALLLQKHDKTVFTKHVASFLLQLESVHNVTNKCINELVEELQFIVSESLSSVKDIVIDFLKNKCDIDHAIVASLEEDLTDTSPLFTVFDKSGPLSSRFKRQNFFRTYFNIVEPVEYVLDPSENRSFQYVPILESLKQLLSDNEICKKAIADPKFPVTNKGYLTFCDGSIYRSSEFYSQEPRICLVLYVDDFEVCNPLGTSKKKHKITSVYWKLASEQSHGRSTLTSVYLALLCNANDIKRFGYKEILKPLLNDIAALEENGIVVPQLGKKVKGSIFCVVADNLGAHSLSGLVESFSGSYICRFCLGERQHFQENEVRSGAFSKRTKEGHSGHVKAIEENPTLNNVCGVKKLCPLTERLTQFHLVEGYPPDILHDLFEGVVPMELAICFNQFIAKKYFSFEELNAIITTFPYKWGDKTDSPQAIPSTYATRRSIGGNAHENWTLIRLLPVMVGHKIPEQDPAWNVLMCLKDIVEIVVAPIQSEASIMYLDSKISEHRHRLQATFPQVNLIPKHHFLEHYPSLMKAYGPLIHFWTMWFEAKHRYFKQIVRHTGNFRNIMKSLAKKHQLMIGQHLQNGTSSTFQASKVSDMPVDVLHPNVQDSIQQMSPGQTSVHVCSTVSVSGTTYAKGMVLAYGSTGGLPDFVQIIQMAILKNKVYFIAKPLIAWYIEHLRGFELENTEQVVFVEHQQLTDFYPLSLYKFKGKPVVMLKRHICLE